MDEQKPAPLGEQFQRGTDAMVKQAEARLSRPKRETDYRVGLSPNQLALFEVLEPAVTMFGDGSHRARQLALVLDAKGFAPRLARTA